MKILALDTATEACSTALQVDGALFTRYSEPKRDHAQWILPMVDEVLAEAGLKLRDLDCIAVGRGPGGFTGVRIAVAAAQGLAYGAGLPVVPVSNLAALAQRAVEEHRTRGHRVEAVLACIDARMNEVYWAGFRMQADGLVLACTEESVTPPQSVSVDWTQDWIAAGTGWAAYPALRDRLQRAEDNKSADTTLPRAQEIVRLAERDFRAGKTVPPEQLLPVYLRDKVAWAGGAASKKSRT